MAPLYNLFLKPFSLKADMSARFIRQPLPGFVQLMVFSSIPEKNRAFIPTNSLWAQRMDLPRGSNRYPLLYIPHNTKMLCGHKGRERERKKRVTAMAFWFSQWILAFVSVESDARLFAITNCYQNCLHL